MIRKLRTLNRHRQSSTVPAHGGFTLVELLVVVVIVGILVSLSLPAMNGVRASGRLAQCKNNLGQIGKAVIGYKSRLGKFPPGGVHTAAVAHDPKNHFLNWMLAILPDLEQNSLWAQYDNSKYNTHPDNRPVLRQHLDIMVCPEDMRQAELLVPTQISTVGPQGIATGSYKGNSGKRWGSNNGFFDYPPFFNRAGRTQQNRGPLHAIGLGKLGQVTDGHVRDGHSETFLAGEYMSGESQFLNATSVAFWGSTHSFHNLGSPQPEHYSRLPDYDQCMALTGNSHWLCDRNFASEHPDNTINFVFCDGRLQSIGVFVDGEVYEALATIDGEEDVELP